MPGQQIQVGPFMGGLNTFSDPTSIADNELVVCENFELDLDGSLKSRPPFVDLAANMTLGVTGNINLLGYFYSPAGGAFLIGSDGLSSTYYFNGTAWVLITNTFAASAMAQYNNEAWLLAPVGSTNPGGKWNGSTFTAVTDMPKGDTIVTHKERLWIALGRDATTNGTRMYWSNTLVDPTFWPVSPNFADVGTGDGQNIVALVVQYNNLMIFRTRSVWSFQYTSSPDQAVQAQVVPGVGLADKRALVQVESYIYWMYEDRAYEFSNSRAGQINQKVPFDSGASASDYYAPFAVSEFNRRVVFSFYDTLYVFGMRTRTWTVWKSPTFQGIGKIFKQEGSDDIQALTHSNKSVALGGSRAAKTISLSDDGTGTETFTCTILTKNFNYEASSVFKRLFWWGVDASFQGTATGYATPISYNHTVTWGALRAKDLTWGQLLPFTWGQPITDIASVETIRSTAGLSTGRKFAKMNKGLRFRQINFRLVFNTDGSSAKTVRLFSLSTFVKPKERVKATLS